MANNVMANGGIERRDRPGTLSAPYTLEYAYKRSTGSVIGGFLTGLREKVLLGAVASDGRVLMPPREYDEAGNAVTGWAPVQPYGKIETFSFVERPRPEHPLDRPFAWALIRLEGADTALLHVVAADRAADLQADADVHVVWSEERSGSIRDISHFALGQGPGDQRRSLGELPSEPPAEDPIFRFKSPMRLDYTITPGQYYARYLGALREGRFIGGRCDDCKKVYVPPRASCPSCGIPTDAELPVADHGTLTTFCVINIPFEGQRLTPPYVFGSIVLDGADVPIFHLISGCPLEEIRMGMRLKAQWKDPSEWEASLENVRFFEPNGEENAAYESYAEHL